MRIGLLAHDSKKKLMQNLCIAYKGIFSRNDIYATGTTGRLIQDVTNLKIHKYLTGNLGGIEQLSSQIEHNQIDLVIFLREPLTGIHDQSTQILEMCDMHNIPIATNLASAELLLKSLDRGDMEWREMYK